MESTNSNIQSDIEIGGTLSKDEISHISYHIISGPLKAFRKGKGNLMLLIKFYLKEKSKNIKLIYF